jgi:hypothetical protein
MIWTANVVVIPLAGIKDWQGCKITWTMIITLNLRGNGQHDFAKIASPIQKCRAHLSPQALNDSIVQNQSGRGVAGSAQTCRIKRVVRVNRNIKRLDEAIDDRGEPVARCLETLLGHGGDTQ